MTLTADNVLSQVNALVDEYRSRCLWFWRADYYPSTPPEALRAVQYIERHGDVAALRRVAPLKQWLLQNSNASSAV